MVDKEQCCKKLCTDAAYSGTVEELWQEASSVGARVQQTWPPTHGGPGFSAFSAILGMEFGGGRNVLAVIFRGTKGPTEWLRYPLSAAGDPIATIEGLRVFSVWADTLNKVWNRYGHAVPGVAAVTMKDGILQALAGGWDVWLTGHSMGGANAQTAAALLLCGNSAPRHRECLSNLSVMTFNAPMSLIEEDAARYEQQRAMYGVEHRRIAGRADAVRYLPPGLGLKHGGDSEEYGSSLLFNVVRGAQLMNGQEGESKRSTVMRGLLRVAGAALANGHRVPENGTRRADEEETKGSQNWR